MSSVIEAPTFRPVRAPARSMLFWLGLTGALVLLAGVALVGWYRLSYHTFDWRAVPPRISYCGRDYDRAATTPSVAAFQQHRLARAHPFPPLLHPLYVENNPLAALGADICPMTLDYQVSNATMVTYGLVGGP